MRGSAASLVSPTQLSLGFPTPLSLSRSLSQRMCNASLNTYPPTQIFPEIQHIAVKKMAEKPSSDC